VSNDYTQPFENYISDGNVANILRMSGITTKVGLFTTAVFTAPQITTFDLELQFVAYYDAYTEVVLPVYNLMMMSSATRTNLTEEDAEQLKKGFELNSGNETVDTIANTIADAGGALVDTVSQATGISGASFSKAFEYIQYAKAPPKVAIRIGNVLNIETAMIADATPEFSNKLDYRNYPLSATVNLTITFERPNFANEFSRMFHS